MKGIFIALITLALVSTASAEQFCKTDEFDRGLVCSTRFKVSDEWHVILNMAQGEFIGFSVVLLAKEWVFLHGDARIKIDAGPPETLTLVDFARDTRVGGVSESTLYMISLDTLRRAANAKQEIWFRPKAKRTISDVKIQAGSPQHQQLVDFFVEIAPHMKKK
jgi:hypothetical protein